MAKLTVIPPTKRQPPLDKEQRRHLQNRINAKAQTLENKLRKSMRRDNWGDSKVPDPPEVAAARRIVRAYEDKLKAEWDQQNGLLGTLQKWLHEQVLFAPSQDSLQFLKAYESMALEDALSAAQSMEDRNDIPVGMPTLKLLPKAS